MKKYTQVYYDEGFSDLIIEKLNKNLKEKEIKLDSMFVQPTGGGTICLYGLYTVDPKESKYLTEK